MAPEPCEGIVMIENHLDHEPIMTAVQLYISGKPVMALSYLTHGETLEETLRRAGVSFEEDGHGPVLQGGEYSVAGMGQVRWESPQKITLFGRSGGYFMEPSPEHLRELLKKANDVEITIKK